MVKVIKVSDVVHKRLMEDRDHFSEVIGYKFTINTTLVEYQKILDGLKKSSKVKK